MALNWATTHAGAWSLKVSKEYTAPEGVVLNAASKAAAHALCVGNALGDVAAFDALLLQLGARRTAVLVALGRAEQELAAISSEMTEGIVARTIARAQVDAVKVRCTRV